MQTSPLQPGAHNCVPLTGSPIGFVRRVGRPHTTNSSLITPKLTHAETERGGRERKGANLPAESLSRSLRRCGRAVHVALCEACATERGVSRLLSAISSRHDTSLCAATCFSRSRRVIWAEALRARIGIMKNVCCFVCYTCSGYPVQKEYMYFS